MWAGKPPGWSKKSIWSFIVIFRGYDVRKPRVFKDELLRQVAIWEYQEGKTKEWIAERVRTQTSEACDRHTVDKMLKLARERGLVHIDFPDIEPPEIKLARRVKAAFPHLQKVIVLPNREGETYQKLLARWGEAAANYFEELLKEALRRGVIL
jgi:DNA-binding transcriptional regulator LsrR (DeoR family)